MKRPRSPWTSTRNFELPRGTRFSSPSNISLCLAMTYTGARGDTAREMADVLHSSLSQDLLHPGFSALDQSLRNRANEGGITLTTANTFLRQPGWPFRESYKDLLAEYHRTELFEVPFATDPEGSRLQINAWVSDNTREKSQSSSRRDRRMSSAGSSSQALSISTALGNTGSTRNLQVIWISTSSMGRWCGSR
jgi:hypothetical protein